MVKICEEATRARIQYAKRLLKRIVWMVGLRASAIMREAAARSRAPAPPRALPLTPSSPQHTPCASRPTRGMSIQVR